MTALAPTFGPAQDVRVFAGAVLAIEIIFQDEDGVAVDLTGRTFAMTVYDVRTEEEVLSRSRVADGTSVAIEYLGEETRRLRAQRGDRSYRLLIAEVTASGTDPIAEGGFSVVAAPLTITPAPSGVSGSPVVQLIRTGDRRQIVFRPKGIPGLSASQEAYQAGLIDEPTPAALTARFDSIAQAAGEAAGAEAGAATAAQAAAPAILAANTARDQANAARDGANQKAALAAEKAGLADSAAAGANTARDQANAARDAANEKAALAAEKAGLADTAAAGANTARDQANAARDGANEKGALAADKAGVADQKAIAAQTAAAAADTARAAAVTATAAATDATARANAAAMTLAVANGPTLLIKPADSWPAIADPYFGGRGKYARFDGFALQPSGFTGLVDMARLSEATYHDSAGVLRVAPPGAARLTYRSLTGAAIGTLGWLLVEATTTNKCTNFNANPVDLTGVGKTGDASSTLAVVDSPAALAAAGLQVICSAGKVFRLDNSAGTATAYAVLAGLTGNTNPHTFSAYARVVSGPGSVVVRNNTTSGVSTTATAFARMSYTKAAPAANEVMWIGASAGTVVEFILNQLEESSFVSSVIVTAGAQTTRAGDVMSKALGAEFNPLAHSLLLRARWSSSVPTGTALYTLSSTSNSDRVFVGVSTAGNIVADCRVGGAVLATINGPPALAETDYKIVVGFGGGVLRLVVNGVAYADANIASVPPLTTRNIGKSGTTSAVQPNGFIQPWLPHPTNPLLDATEYPRLLTVAEMQGYTA